MCVCVYAIILQNSILNWLIEWALLTQNSYRDVILLQRSISYMTRGNPLLLLEPLFPYLWVGVVTLLICQVFVKFKGEHVCGPKLPVQHVVGAQFAGVIMQQLLSWPFPHPWVCTNTCLRPQQIGIHTHLFWSERLHFSVLADKACSSCLILPSPGRTKKTTVSLL